MRGAEVDDGRHAPPTQSLAGSWIHGRYEVLRELGWGSLGHVYEALDHLRPDAQGEPGRVALKVIRRDRLSPRSVAFLKQEFRALSRLDHPHVARVHDLDLVPGRGELFFSLELLLGPTLVARARAGGGPDPALVVELTVQALRALAYVHARGLIHMDLKPQNLLVLERVGGPHLKLLDFHLARELGGPTDREMRGTIAYMAPEVIKGEPTDARTDLYSLGAVLYEALGGRPPFAHALSPMDMLRAHAKEPPPPLAELGAQVDPLLEAVVRRLLAKEPGERFAGAEEALKALSAAAGRSFTLETEETRRSSIRSGRFVGRDDELEQALRPAKQLVAAGSEAPWEPWVWLVQGEPGSGKSRFLAELKVACQLEGLPCLLLRPGGVDAAPYGPLREALGELLRRAGGRAELLAALQDESGAVDPGRLVALRGDPSLPPRVRQGAALRELLEELAAEAPYALLLDDLEQCDDGTLEVVRALASGPAPRALLVAATGAEAAGSQGRLVELLPLPGVQVLELRQLGRAATAELIASMAPGQEVAEELVARVWALASGNPRFVADVLRGLLEGEEGRDDASPRPDAAPRLDAAAAERLLPASSLRELSARRVALLPSPAQLLLGALACSPRPRPLAFAAAVARLPLPRAREAVRELERRGFAERLPGSGWDRELWPVAIEHAPLREAALEALASAEAGVAAPELHARAARLLESRHPVAAEPTARGETPAPDRAEELLWHLERAGDRAGALRYAWQAGQAALRRGEPLRALGLLERAERQLATLDHERPAGAPDRVALGLALAEARAATGDAAAAGALLEELARSHPSPPVHRALGAFLRERGRLRAALDQLDRAAASGPGEAEEGPWIAADRARTLLWMGEYRATLAAGELALQGFAAAGRGSEPPGELLVAMAHASQFLGRPGEAQLWLRRAGAALPAGEGEPAASARVGGERAALAPPLLGDAAGVQVARGPLEAALQRTERAGDAARHYARRVQLLEAAGDAEGAAWAELNLAHLRRAAGEHLGARVAYERARRGFEAADSQLGLALVRLGLARALAEGGAPARAAAEAAEALALGEATGARWVPAQAEVARAEAALARGALREAGEALGRAGALARALEHAPLLAELDLLRAELALLEEDEPAARAALAAWDEAPGGAPSALLAARADLARTALQARGAATEEARARLAPAEGRAAAALSLAERAGLPELTWRAVATRAEVRAARGDAEGELQDLVRAMEVLRGLCERVPAEERADYLGDPRRAALRERFRALPR